MPAPSVFEIFADALHAAYARLFARRVTTNNPSARHHRAPGRPAMVLAGKLTLRLGLERTAREHARRCAEVLDGARRGRRIVAELRASVAMETNRTKARMRVKTLPARQRYASAVTATRAAAREVAAVAASTARRMGARHRHVPGSTDVHHNLVRDLVAYAKQYEKRRATGERSIWQQGRTRYA